VRRSASGRIAKMGRKPPSIPTSCLSRTPLSFPDEGRDRRGRATASKAILAGLNAERVISGKRRRRHRPRRAAPAATEYAKASGSCSAARSGKNQGHLLPASADARIRLDTPRDTMLQEGRRG